MTQDSQQPHARLLDEFPLADLAAWRSEVERLLKGAPFAKKMFTKTLEGITVGPMYTANDTADLPWSEHGPGQAPFVRGHRSAGYHQAGWWVSQELPYPTVEEFNNALRLDLKRGQNTVILKLDHAGLRGLDPDQAAPGTVGKNGTSLAALSELEIALDGVDLDNTPLCIQSGAASLPLGAMVAALAKKQGRNLAQWQGALGSDPVYGLACEGTLTSDLDQIYDELAVLTSWAQKSAPRFTTLPVLENSWHQGGADSALSLGLTLASAVHALKAMEKRGMDPVAAAANMRFRMVVGTDFFMEIAKIRALRLLWTDIISACGGTPEQCKVAIHVQTSPRCLTVTDMHVNMLRATTMAMSAVMGGADALHVSPFDEVDSLPDEFSRRIARNVQLILAEECHFDQVTDPAGGSWYVEKLTAELAKRAWEEFQTVEKNGGIVAGLQGGLVQKKIAECASQRQSRLATGKDVLVGTTKYVNPLEPERQPRVPDYKAIHEMRAKAMPQLRTAAAHEDHLIVLKRLETIMTADGEKLFDSLTEAASQGATLGEMTGILRHNSHRPIQVEPIPLRRDSEPFEKLRHQVAVAAEANPAVGKVFCAGLGNFARYMPRLDFVRGFFQVGGFQFLADQFYNSPDEVLAAAKSAGAATVVLVGLDTTYAEMAVSVAQKLMTMQPPPRVILAGMPGDLEDSLNDVGVTDFVHVRSNLLEVLGDLVSTKEVGE